ncbi:chemotaxis protein CheW [Poseidonocella sp. HB161398]|uniref:chemotaxis protein CheW n=1 Tax=Poseidonocella sp. HB161398 TaxID=2320855 RepID=UPI001107CC03|nr:chemotaxis protein CheW [Poseidonocella sp. HB161398]
MTGLSSSARPTADAAGGRDMVTFRLGGELLALPTGILREILEPVRTTRVPNAPDFAPGLINVRGAVVPLADLRVPLRMPRPPADEHTRIMVVELVLNEIPSVVGILAERVHEVTSIDDAALEDLPGVGTTWPPQFVIGIGRWQDSFVMLPDLDAIFSAHLAGESGAQPTSGKDCLP